MKPQEFRKYWTANGDTFSQLKVEKLQEFYLKQATVEFLTMAGLPNEAAPFLSFVNDTDDIFYGISKLTTQYVFLEPEFVKYVVIGSCGNGDPIVINTERNDEIEWLNHEDNFSPQLFNSSINALAECLVSYREFVATIQEENGEEALMNAYFTDKQFDGLKQKLIQADSKVVLEDGFWKGQLELELALRQDFRNNKK